MCSGARSSSAKIASSWRARLGIRMGDFEQHRPVALHDEGTVSHKDRSYRRAAAGSLCAGAGQDAGRTLTMLVTGRVRSMSAARSRPRSRPPPRPGRLEGEGALGAVGHPHHHDDLGAGTHRLLELAAEPRRFAVGAVAAAQHGDQPRVGLARVVSAVGIRGRGARRCSGSGAPEAPSATTG